MEDRATKVDLATVRSARARVGDVVLTTPVLPIDSLPNLSAYVKCENLQRTGSFKLRGLYNRIATLDPARVRGIVILSAGNAGAAAAWSAQFCNLPCVVVTPPDCVPTKKRLIERFNGKVVGVERREDMEPTAHSYVEEFGYTLIDSHDDPAVIAGQGTVALEMLDQLDGLDALIVPTGGGGLAAGSAVVLRELAPDVRLIAAEAAGAATLKPSLAADRVVRIAHVETIADGLATSTYGMNTFQLVRDFVSDVIVVSEAAILDAMAFAWRELHLAIEPSAAVALAALLERAKSLEGHKAAAVLSGGNLEVDLLVRALRATAA